MKKILFFLSLLSLLSLFFIKLPISAEAPISNKTDRIILKFKPTAPKKVQDVFFKNYSLKTEKLRLNDTFVIKSKINTVDLLKIILQISDIEYAEPDFVATKLEVPNDPNYPSQWGLQAVQSSSAWNITHGSSSVRIAIVDTGIEASHPDLGSKIILRANFTNVADSDGDGHGTHVAGIASAITNNNVGVAGMGYDTPLLSVKVLDNSGSGYYSWVASGITWASDNGAKVINLSLGGTSSSRTLQNAVNYAWNKGVVVVAAAGNNNSTRKFYPAYYSNAIAVAATDKNDVKASFSNYGTWVDVAAPGVSIFSTYKGGSYTNLSGTSMATPFVSGLAGLVAGMHPEWTSSQIRSKIESTADKISGTGKYWYYGRINACQAVDCGFASSSPTPTPTPTLTPTPTSIPPTPTNSPTPTFTPTPTPVSSTPTPTPIPWWCVRWPSLCQ